MNLSGKTAVVTGAARGLGRVYAHALSKQGMNVVAADRDQVNTTIDAMDSAETSLGVRVDVSDIASVEAMVGAAIDRFGSIDVLINNAALYGSLHTGRAETIEETEWDLCMAVNVKGAWNCCRAIIPHMRAQGGGSIVNISSLAAVMGMPYSLHYSTSKAAVIGMTRALARELGRDWIRVNAVAPTAVATEGTNEFFGEKVDRQLDIALASQSLRKTLDADDLVGTIVYLASDASRFVTGQTIMVDGGTVFL